MAESYRRIRRANLNRDLDRGQWASEAQLLIGFDFEGVGAEQVGVEFGIVFEGTPLYSWGVELQEDEILTPGDYPHITSGIVSWATKQVAEDQAGTLLYSGATIWYRSAASRAYRTRLRTSFEGIVYKNPQYFVGE